MAKIVFMGSPAFAVPSLEALHDAGHEIVAVYSQPPRPAGRGQKLQKTAVHEAAEDLGLAVFTPEKLRGEDLDFVLGLDADVFCVVGFGMLLPAALVDNRVCLNVHPSALPKWRGATPVQSAIMAGETSTDVCIMRLEAGMDTGPVYDRTPVKIDRNMTAGELNDVVWSIGAKRLVAVVDNVHELEPVAQVGDATRAYKITAETRVIDWSQRVQDVHNLVRALSPSPGATAKLGGEVFKILRTEVNELWIHKVMGEPGEVMGMDSTGVVIACGVGAIKLVEMQRAGGKAAAAGDLARSWKELRTGVRLG
jgi:methionyl-tRNA formyltransferase